MTDLLIDTLGAKLDLPDILFGLFATLNDSSLSLIKGHKEHVEVLKGTLFLLELMREALISKHCGRGLPPIDTLDSQTTGLLVYW